MCELFFDRGIIFRIDEWLTKTATEKNIYFPSRNEKLQLEGGAGNVLGSKCKNNRRGGLPSDGWPLHRSCNDVNKEITVAIPGGGGYFLIRG